MKVCSVYDCGREAKARGMCKKHWTRWRRHGDPGVTLKDMRAPDVCQVERCDTVPHRRGLCRGHWNRLEQHGTVAAEVPLSEGGWALRRWLAEQDCPPSAPTCRDCGGDPMPGGAARCLDCFHVWVDDRRKRREQRGRAAGLASARKSAGSEVAA